MKYLQWHKWRYVPIEISLVHSFNKTHSYPSELIISMQKPAQELEIDSLFPDVFNGSNTLRNLKYDGYSNKATAGH
jgi:hypothetical protein